jgi:chromosome segregation ATPase
MDKTAVRWWRMVVLVALVACTIPGGTAGTRVSASQQAQPAATTDSMSLLLAEVRALRIAMERQASMGPRIQLTVARLSIEEQRVTHLSSQLDSIREQLSTAGNATGGGMKERLAEIERSLTIEADPTKRAALESEHQGLKQAMSDSAATEQRLRERENETAQALASEQARWSELSSRLDELERSLAPVR